MGLMLVQTTIHCMLLNSYLTGSENTLATMIRIKIGERECRKDRSNALLRRCQEATVGLTENTFLFVCRLTTHVELINDKAVELKAETVTVGS